MRNRPYAMLLGFRSLKVNRPANGLDTICGVVGSFLQKIPKLVDCCSVLTGAYSSFEEPPTATNAVMVSCKV